MMDFIRSCYRWIAENYKEITMILTSAQFASIVTSLVLLYKNIKKTAENVASSKKLDKSMEKNEALALSVDEVKAQNAKLVQQNATLQTEVEKLEKETTNYQDVLLKKLNCMLEVQSLVYSTIKDDTIRSTVNSILVGAKYAETETRDALKRELENLKAQLDEETKKVQSITENASANLSKIVEPEKQNTVVRY